MTQKQEMCLHKDSESSEVASANFWIRYDIGIQGGAYWNSNSLHPRLY